MTELNAGRPPHNFRVDIPTTKQVPHYRLTAAEARLEFIDGLSTVRGYIYHLLKSSRKDGHKFRIKNVKSFCEEHGFSTSAYYKAIAELKAIGRIDFEVHSSMDLWIPEKVISLEDKTFSKSVETSTIMDTPSTIVDTPSTIVDAKTPNASPTQVPSDSSTIFQSSYSSFKEREKKEINQASKLGRQEGSPQLSAEMKGSDPDSAQVAKLSYWENFSAPGDEPDFFEFVVNKAAKFNDPVPADVRCAAEGWIRKQGHLLYPEYLRWQDAQRQADERLASAAVEVTPPPQAELESESVEQRLQRYQILWKTPVCRSGIKQMIANHPEWSLTIGPNGPQWAEGTLEVPVAKTPTVVRSQSWVSEPVLDHGKAIPDDLSDVLVEIDLHLRRLGWDAEQVRGHLQQMYGKCSRQMLSGQELIHFLECLQAQNQ